LAPVQLPNLRMCIWVSIRAIPIHPTFSVFTGPQSGKKNQNSPHYPAKILCWIVCVDWFISCKNQSSVIVCKHTLLLTATHPLHKMYWKTVTGCTTWWIQRIQWTECLLKMCIATCVCVCVCLLCLCVGVLDVCVCIACVRVCAHVVMMFLNWKENRKYSTFFMWCYDFYYGVKYVIWYMCEVRVVLL
jgi:hypothetical protein